MKTIMLATVNAEPMGCHNCAHRYGMFRAFWRCSRVGFYTDTEMKFKGNCNRGDYLALWSPRQSLIRRIAQFFKGAA